MGRHKIERRWRLERKFAILKVVKENESSTWQIQRTANLSYIEMHKLTDELVALGMLAKEQRGIWGGANLGKKYARSYYSLTEKGRRTLRLFEEIEEQFRLQDKPINLIPY